MTCPNCGGENLTDYPVCMACAPKCHAIGRIEIGLNCIHCDIQKEICAGLGCGVVPNAHANCIHCDIQRKTLELIEQVADLQNPRFNNAAYMELIVEMDRLADLAQDLLAEMKGGNNE